MGAFVALSSLALMLAGLVSGDSIKFLLVTESTQQDLNQQFKNGFKEVESSSGETFDFDAINFTRRGSDEAFQEMCGKLRGGSFSAVVDLAWGGWIKGRKVANSLGLPYIRVEAANHPFVQAADDFLREENAADAAIIFENQEQLDQSLYYIIGNSFLRVVGARQDDPSSFDRLKKMRPRPTNYVVWGSAASVRAAHAKAKSLQLLKRDTRWTLVVEDLDGGKGITSEDVADDQQINFITGVGGGENCCIVKNIPGKGPCDCSAKRSLAQDTATVAGKLLATALVAMKKSGTLPKQAWDCTGISFNSSSGNNSSSSNSNSNVTRNNFNTAVEAAVTASTYLYMRDKNGVPLITAPIKLEMRTKNRSGEVMAGAWNPKDRFAVAPGYVRKDIRRFFRVGIVLGKPWAWIEGSDNPTAVASVDDTKPNRGIQGYCIDLLGRLSTLMDFDYELVPNEVYGYRTVTGNGSTATSTWSGVVGDLMSGEIDISVAALTMTTEREEVIDFVAPYFDQSGISILLRKKEPKQSIFKFMSVLKPEVWLGILGAVIVVALLIWALDRFSPYSYHNNKMAYPEGARDFTLGESLWFSLTSLTPQGGGECPKALSGRVLVAAYWLFIVLMLATFTANLAAFLTVERMQTTVQSLEELARQSRINYTVVGDSPYLEYFINMAGAEEELYRKWKEITLNSTADQTRYRVWDYPVREQYTHILKVVRQNTPVKSAQEGFHRVDEATDGGFAFIHDASEVRYQYYENCNYTEVGEPFAEQPLAVAVQQGSHLQKEISKTILELQKERYFESLSGQYWRSSKRNDCPVLDDSQGITLRSLGGIFLATLCGLLLSMITLAYEVWQQKKLEKNKVHEFSPTSSASKEKGKIITVGSKQIRNDNYNLPGF